MAFTASVDTTKTPPLLTVTSDFRLINGTVSATSNGQTVSAPYTLQWALTITDPAHTWTKVSDNGTVATYSY